MGALGMLLVRANWWMVRATVTVPDPAGDPPKEVTDKVTMFLGWLRYGGMAAGVGGLIICGVMMAAGQRNRHALSADGATGVPWALAGVSLVVLASTIVSAFV